MSTTCQNRNMSIFVKLIILNFTFTWLFISVYFPTFLIIVTCAGGVAATDLKLFDFSQSQPPKNIMISAAAYIL